MMLAHNAPFPLNAIEQFQFQLFQLVKGLVMIIIPHVKILDSGWSRAID